MDTEFYQNKFIPGMLKTQVRENNGTFVKRTIPNL